MSIKNWGFQAIMKHLYRLYSYSIYLELKISKKIKNKSEINNCLVKFIIERA